MLLTLGFLALHGGVLGCRPDSRQAPRRDPEHPPVAVLDIGEGKRQLAEIDRIGPSARTDRAALVRLGQAIRNPQHDVANRAAYWLGEVGPAAVPILLASLADSSPRIRISACYALGLLGRDARTAVPALTRQLAGGSDSVANMADWALTQIVPAGRTALVPELRSLRYGTAEQRADAAFRLALLGEASVDAIPLLVRSLADSEGAVAESAGDALVRIGARSVPAVQAALLSDNHTLRARALVVLSRLRPHSHF